MNVSEPTAVEAVQNPSGQWSSQVAVQCRHCAVLNTAQPPGTHHELISLVKARHEGCEQSKVIGAVGITHHDISPTDIRNRILISASQSSLRGTENSGPARQGEFCSSVIRTVDYEDLSADARITETLVAPGYEFGDGEFLVDGGYNDRYFRIWTSCSGIRSSVARSGPSSDALFPVPLARRHDLRHLAPLFPSQNT